MLARLPVKIIVASADPSPVVKLRPAIPESVISPLLATSVTCSALLPASTSLMLIRLPLPALNTSTLSWAKDWVPGTELNGASLIAVTARVSVVLLASEVPVPELPGSMPVLPPSSMATVRVTLATELAAVRKFTWLAAMKALISARPPTRVRLPVPEPLTVTPLPLVAFRLPLGTERTTVTAPLPASTSVKLMPVMAPGWSSFTAMLPGALILGASLTAVTCKVVMVEAVALLAVSMLTIRVTLAVALLAVVKLRLLPAMKVLILAIVPVRVRAEPVPPTTTPPPLMADKVPEPTEKVTVAVLESASLKLMPVTAVAVSSLTDSVAGALTCGVSLTAVTLTVLVATVLSRLPSLIWKLTVRLAVLGASDRLV
ncbi:hypothetical protein D3C77_87420 [compost metagenome]